MTGVLSAPAPAAHHPGALGQWAALTGRLLRAKLRYGGFLVAVVAPLVFTLGFYLPLRYIMSFRNIDYAQFVMALIVLQTMSFQMMGAAGNAAAEAQSGLVQRMQTMPVAPYVPLAARMAGSLADGLVGLAASLLWGHLIGFRMHGGPVQALMFCLLALAVGLTLALGADALGMLTRSPEAVGQALTLPTLIFGVLSCGFAPETGFPEWIRPFVREQPVSQLSFALRDLADPGYSMTVVGPGLVWLGAVFVLLAPLAVWASGRRQ